MPTSPSARNRLWRLEMHNTQFEARRDMATSSKGHTDKSPGIGSASMDSISRHTSTKPCLPLILTRFSSKPRRGALQEAMPAESSVEQQQQQQRDMIQSQDAASAVLPPAPAPLASPSSSCGDVSHSTASSFAEPQLWTPPTSSIFAVRPASNTQQHHANFNSSASLHSMSFSARNGTPWSETRESALSAAAAELIGHASSSQTDDQSSMLTPATTISTHDYNSGFGQRISVDAERIWTAPQNGREISWMQYNDAEKLMAVQSGHREPSAGQATPESISIQPSFDRASRERPNESEQIKFLSAQEVANVISKSPDASARWQEILRHLCQDASPSASRIAADARKLNRTQFLSNTLSNGQDLDARLGNGIPSSSPDLRARSNHRADDGHVHGALPQSASGSSSHRDGLVALVDRDVPDKGSSRASATSVEAVGSAPDAPLCSGQHTSLSSGTSALQPALQTADAVVSLGLHTAREPSDGTARQRAAVQPVLGDIERDTKWGSDHGRITATNIDRHQPSLQTASGPNAVCSLETGSRHGAKTAGKHSLCESSAQDAVSQVDVMHNVTENQAAASGADGLQNLGDVDMDRLTEGREGELRSNEQASGLTARSRRTTDAIVDPTRRPTIAIDPPFASSSTQALSSSESNTLRGPTDGIERSQAGDKRAMTATLISPSQASESTLSICDRLAEEFNAAHVSIATLPTRHPPEMAMENQRSQQGDGIEMSAAESNSATDSLQDANDRHAASFFTIVATGSRLRFNSGEASLWKSRAHELAEALRNEIAQCDVRIVYDGLDTIHRELSRIQTQKQQATRLASPSTLSPSKRSVSPMTLTLEPTSRSRASSRSVSPRLSSPSTSALQAPMSAHSSPTASASKPRGGRPQLARLDTSERIKRATEARSVRLSAGDGSLPARSPGSAKASPDMALQRVDRGKTSMLPPQIPANLSPSNQKRRESEPVIDRSGKMQTEDVDTLVHAPLPARSHSVASGSDTVFEPSEIVKGFLYLGPEIATLAQARYLRKSLGVQCILNAAEEIEVGGGSHLRLDSANVSGFAVYKKVPLRDSIEATNVQRHIDETCAFLDEARANAAPVYVHCKAGKSRSVMLVMAYLIYTNRWTTKQAYAYVVERRQGVSPNIGFVAELMAFEERTLRPSSEQT